MTNMPCISYEKPNTLATLWFLMSFFHDFIRKYCFTMINLTLLKLSHFQKAEFTDSLFLQVVLNTD